MNNRTILANGVEMPVLGFGTWKLTGESCTDLTAYALKNGYRSIDTAQVYENEEAVGAALQEVKSLIPREEIFVTSKVRNRFQGYNNTCKAVEWSLRRLGTDYIDLYLIHWPGEDMYVPTWKALIRMYEEGVLRSIGVSNFYPKHIERIREETGFLPMVNQIETHPYYHQYEVIDYCRANDIFLEAWSPLMFGKEALQDELIGEIARKHKKSPAQVILRWHIQNGFGAIPKSSDYERIKENLQIFDFQLEPDDMKVMNELTKKQVRIGDDPLTYRFKLLDELLAEGAKMKKDSFGEYY